MILESLKKLPNVSNDFRLLIKQRPLVEGEIVPAFWGRSNGKSALLFFPNPNSEEVTYPVAYGQSFQDSTIIRTVNINFNQKSIPVMLAFKPYQSLLLKISENGVVNFENIYFMPKTPSRE